VRDGSDCVGAPGRIWANEDGISLPGEREGMWGNCY
jgi:hypothetical protein